MKGKVQGITHETSKKGDEYLRVQIDGEIYSVWEPDYFDVLREGDTIEFEYKESGQWKNITHLLVSGPQSEGTPSIDEYRLARDRQIARMSCVKSAANVLANLEMNPEEKGKRSLELAKIFEKYVYDEDITLPQQTSE